MSRTNIDIDDELAAEVMRRFGLQTKEAAVDLALRRLVGPPLNREFLLDLEGVGWEGDLDDLRSDRLGLRHGAKLVHRDADFEVISRITSLDAESLR